jgi:hypothetical protein
MVEILESASTRESTQLPRWLSLHSLGKDHIGNNGPNASSIAVAGHCLATARLFIEPLLRNGKCLSSHVTFLPP